MLGQRPEVAARLVPRQAGPCIFSTGVRPQRARRLLARADTSPQTRLSIASEREKAAEDGEDAPQSSSSQDDFTQEQGGVLAANPVGVLCQLEQAFSFARYSNVWSWLRKVQSGTVAVAVETF